LTADEDDQEVDQLVDKFLNGTVAARVGCSRPQVKGATKRLGPKWTRPFVADPVLARESGYTFKPMSAAKMRAANKADRERELWMEQQAQW
jgi:hypothetical protein